MLYAGGLRQRRVGAPHRITNEHDEPLIIIEVQHGTYTGEDDICRLEDDYGRLAQLRATVDSLTLGGVRRLGRRLVGAPPVLVVWYHSTVWARPA